MAINLQEYKIEVFKDVNDIPTAPTESNAGNGSHLIAQYNSLVNSTEQFLNNLENADDQLRAKSTGKWVVKNEDVIVIPGDKVILHNNQPLTGKTVYYLYVPSNPEIGSTFSYLSVNTSIEVELRDYTDQPLNVSHQRVDRAFSKDEFIMRTFVFIPDYNWLLVQGLPMTYVYPTGS